MKRVELSYIPLRNIASAINKITGETTLDGSDIFVYLTDIAGITYDADQQGVVSNLGFVLTELSELTAEDLDSHYHFGRENDPETLQPIVDAIAELHSKVCTPDGGETDDYWNTVIISENGD
jgi:hypothetical protein